MIGRVASSPRVGGVVLAVVVALIGSVLVVPPAAAKRPTPHLPTPATKVVAGPANTAAPRSTGKPKDPTLRRVPKSTTRAGSKTATPRALQKRQQRTSSAASSAINSNGARLAATSSSPSPTGFSSIAISPSLHCVGESAAYAAHPSQFYGGNACATFLIVDGITYGPTPIPAGPSVTAWTPVSQSQAGSGSSADPLVIMTTVAAGDSGVQLTQTDTLDGGVWRVQARVDNPQGRAVSRLSTARDCFVASSDVGLGQADAATGITFCEGDSAALALVPGDPGGSWFEGSYGAAWQLAVGDADLPNQYEPAAVDNGQALSWALTGAASQTRSWKNILITGPAPDQAGQAPNPSLPPTTCSSGQPVNCATGDFWHTFTDVAVPARGLPLGVSRTYDLVNAGVDGAFGYGWSNSFGLQLTATSETTAEVRQETGSTVSFTLLDGTWSAASYVAARLSRVGSDWVFTRPDTQLSYVFTSDGALREIRSAVGETLSLARDSAGRLTAISHAGHGTITLAWDGSHVSSVTGPTGATVRYAYSGGDLTSVTGPGGATWRFEYDEAHHLVSMTDPLRRATINTFDSSFRVVKQVQPSGGVITWSYEGDPASAAGGVTTMVDERGVETRYQFSTMLLLRRDRTGGGLTRTTRFTYDLVTLRLSAVSDDGVTRRSSYDAAGRLVSSTDGAGYLTAYGYDGDSNRLATVTTATGRVSRSSYDDRGRLVRSEDGVTTRTYVYGDPAHPADVTSSTEGDRTTSFGYDDLGNVTTASVAGPSGGLVLRATSYDAAGRAVCSVTPTRYTAGVRCGSSTNHLTGTTTTRFDDAGNATVQTDASGGRTTSSYDVAGRILTSTDATGATTTFGYDSADRVASVVRGAGTSDRTEITTTSDVPAGRRGCPTDFGTVSCTITSNGSKTTVTGYDASGDVVSSVRPGGGIDGMDRRGGLVTQLTRSDGVITGYSYTGDRLAGMYSSVPGSTTGGGGATASRVAPISVSFGYDADGRRTSMDDATGSTIWEYDVAGSLLAETTARGTVRGVRDAHGDLTSISYPDGSTVQRSYDAAGRLIAVTDWTGRTTRFSVDPNGSVTATALPNGRSIDAELDPQGALTALSVPGTGVRLDYERDAVLRVTKETVAGLPGSGASTISYDPLGKLAAVAGVATASDASANPVTVAGTTQTFDQALALATRASSGNPITFASNAAGERTSAVTANGSRTAYGYDSQSRLDDVVAASGPVVSSISVRAGSSAGGSSVVLTGSGFLPGSTVWFGTRTATVTATSATSLTVTVPPGSGSVPVTVSSPLGRSVAAATTTYDYLKPTVTALSVRSGVAAGGQTLTLSGWNLGGTTSVKFGTVAARFSLVSAEKLTVITPKGSGVQHVVVTTAQGASAATSADTFTFVSAPIVSSVSPQAGPAKTVITVTGANFSGATQVLVGTVKATAVAVSSSTVLKATVPAGSGVQHVSVRSARGTSAATGSDVFGYAAGPRVLSLSATTARAAGGTVVTVTGAGFAKTSTATVNGVKAATTYVSSSSLRVTVPASSAVSGHLVVATGSVSSPKVPRALVTYLRPAVSALSVRTGPVEGGQTLTVTGTRFTGATRVTFAGRSVTPRSVTSTSLQVNTPTGAGTVDVLVVTPEGNSLAVAVDRYTFSAAPIITGLRTEFGGGLVAARGGTTITLSGYHLDTLTGVRVGSAEAQLTARANDQVELEAPAGASVAGLTATAGSVAAVALTTLRVTYSERDDRYRYDGLGRLVEQSDTTGTSTTTVWDPFSSDPTPLVHGGWRLITGAGNLPIAQVDAQDQAFYPVLDQRAAPRALLDSAGAAVSAFAYGPYGAITEATGTLRPVVGFGGGLTLAGGLVLLGHRVLDPATGTFLTVDPALSSTGDPYVYAGADPYNRIDRQGLWPTIVVGAVIGAVVGGVANTVSYALSPGDKSLGGFVGAAAEGVVSGGVTGACLGTGVGLLAAAGCAAAGSAAGSVVGQLTKNAIDPGPDEFSWADVGISAAVGGLTSAAGGVAAKAFFSRFGGDITQAQIRSWSNLRNSGSWLPGRIRSAYWKESWIGGIVDGSGQIGRNWLQSLLDC